MSDHSAHEINSLNPAEKVLFDLVQLIFNPDIPVPTIGEVSRAIINHPDLPDDILGAIHILMHHRGLGSNFLVCFGHVMEYMGVRGTLRPAVIELPSNRFRDPALDYFAAPESEAIGMRYINNVELDRAMMIAADFNEYQLKQINQRRMLELSRYLVDPEILEVLKLHKFLRRYSKEHSEKATEVLVDIINRQQSLLSMRELAELILHVYGIVFLRSWESAGFDSSGFVSQTITTALHYVAQISSNPPIITIPLNREDYDRYIAMLPSDLQVKLAMPVEMKAKLTDFGINETLVSVEFITEFCLAMSRLCIAYDSAEISGEKTREGSFQGFNMVFDHGHGTACVAKEHMLKLAIAIKAHQRNFGGEPNISEI